MPNIDEAQFTLMDYVAGDYPSYLPSDPGTKEDWEILWMSALDAAESFFDMFYASYGFHKIPETRLGRHINPITTEANNLLKVYLDEIELVTKNAPYSLCKNQTIKKSQFLTEHQALASAAYTIWHAQNHAKLPTYQINSMLHSKEIELTKEKETNFSMKAIFSARASKAGQGRGRKFDELKNHFRELYIKTPPTKPIDNWKNYIADEIIEYALNLDYHGKKPINPSKNYLIEVKIDEWRKDLNPIKNGASSSDLPHSKK